jgi:fatty acid desaturase
LLSVNDICQLRQTLESKGCFKSVRFRAMLQLIAMLLIFIIGYSIALKVSLPLGLFLLLPLSIPLAVIMMMGHEAGHQAIFHSRVMDNGLFLFLFPLIGGMSATYWTYKHNNKHHSAPNVLGRDNDIELWPIAFYKEKMLTSGSSLKFFQTHLQHWLFWGLCFFTVFSMKLDGMIYLFRQRHELNKSMATDIALLIMHYSRVFKVSLILSIITLSYMVL